MFNKVKLLREKVFIDKVVETKFPGNWFMSRLNVSLRRSSLIDFTEPRARYDLQSGSKIHNFYKSSR